MEASNGKKGNYLVFFPSYRFLEDVYEAFEKIQEKEELAKPSRLWVIELLV